MIPSVPGRRFPLRFGLLLLLVLSGCAGESPPQQGSDGATKRMTLSSISPPKSFNPVTAKETSTTEITSLMYAGLTRTDGVTGEVEPHLARSWDVREEGRVWEFTLREGLRWSDGEPLTAADVTFTYNRLYLNPDVTATSRFMLLMDGRPPEVTRLSDTRVRFTYPEPYAPFDRAAGLAILPRHVAAPLVENGTFNSAWGVDTDPDSMVVNGPFRLRRYQSGQRVILERNPHYHEVAENGDELPRLDRVHFEIVGSREVQLQKFTKGDIDAFSAQGDHVALLKPREEELNFELHRVGPSLGTTMLAFNMNTDTNPETGETYIPRHKLRWFNDRAFRRAVSYGIDREGMINIVLNGLGVPIHGPVSPANKPFYNENLDTYPHDPDRARALLAENGYRDRDGDGVREGPRGHPVEFVLNTNSGNDQRVGMAEIIRQDLDNLGFEVTFNQLEFNTLVNRLNSDFDWEAIVIGFTGSLDPHFGSNLWRSSADLHLWHPRQDTPARPWEAEIDRLFRRAVKQTDRGRRRTLYDRWQRIVNEVQPVVFTVNPEQIYAIRDRFTHVKPTAIGGYRHNIERIGVRR